MYSVVLLMALSSSGETPDIGRRGGCHGGGGCYGGMAYGGCYGGRRGGRRGGGCYGGGMGYGGCYGGGMGYGGCYGGMASGAMPVSYGGCYGGMPVGGAGGYGMPGMMAPPAGGQPEGVKKMPRPSGGSAMAPAPATLVVELPAEARLTIDGDPTTSTSEHRVFVSPELNPGRDYHYTLKAEIMRDGKPVTVAREVAVRAGEETQVTLTLPNKVAQR